MARRDPAFGASDARCDRRRGLRRSGASAGAALAAGIALLAGPGAVAQTAPSEPRALPPYAIVGDAIPAPLTTVPGDAARGRAIVANRQVGLCLLCHSGPFPEERFQGDLAPSLAGAGARWSAGQLRLRLVDPRRLVPATIMPAYYRIDGLTRVAASWRSRPLLDAQQVEDVVALLATLRE